MTTPAVENAPAPTLPRLPALTGLRFLAAAAVVGYHVGRYVEPLSAVRFVTGLGYSGVGFHKTRL